MLDLDRLNRYVDSHGALTRGRGLVSGTIALTLAILCLLATLCTLRTCLLAALVHLLRSCLHYGVQVVDS